MSGDCRRCRSWKDCPGKEWYSFSDIRWCVQQVFWLLKYAWMLRQGVWPSPETLLEGGVRGRQMIAEGRFAKAVLVIAEVDKRLARTGLRGELLAEQCINREKMEYLTDNARDALYYVAGWNRKSTSFGMWLAKRNYRSRGYKNVAQVRS